MESANMSQPSLTGRRSRSLDQPVGAGQAVALARACPLVVRTPARISPTPGHIVPASKDRLRVAELRRREARRRGSDGDLCRTSSGHRETMSATSRSWTIGRQSREPRSRLQESALASGGGRDKLARPDIPNADPGVPSGAPQPLKSRPPVRQPSAGSRTLGDRKVGRRAALRLLRCGRIAGS